MNQEAPTGSVTSYAGSAAASSTRQNAEAAQAQPPRGRAPLSQASAGSAAPGLLGASVSTFLREIVAGRALVGTKAEWIAYWRQRVMQLALLAHQYRNGAVGREALEKMLYEMGVKFGALFLYGSYALEVRGGEAAGVSPPFGGVVGRHTHQGWREAGKGGKRARMSWSFDEYTAQ